LAFGLGFSPADQAQKESVRLMYVHVPSVWLAYLAFIVTAVSSGCYLFAKKHALGWDRLAGASAEVGVLFMAITLITGALWGRLTWGVFWRWDARLTTTAFLFVTYVGYLAVRRLGGTHHQRARRSAIVALLAVVLIPLVHFSVEIWRSLHQEATVLNPEGDVEIEGLMLFSLALGVLAFTLLYLWLVIHRQRTLAVEDALDDQGLDLALAERRGEASATLAGGARGGG
jgi:heme exporter protein C